MLKLPGSEALGELDNWGGASPLGFTRMSANGDRLLPGERADRHWSGPLLLLLQLNQLTQ